MVKEILFAHALCKQYCTIINEQHAETCITANARQVGPMETERRATGQEQTLRMPKIEVMSRSDTESDIT